MRGSADAESEIYADLSQRFDAAGEGWRDRALPWTPSFVPWPLQHGHRSVQRPADLLDEVLKLRDEPSVKRYREARNGALAGDEAAFAELEGLAGTVARALDVNREELATTRNVLVEILPKALGAAAGAAIGATGGPVGAAVGAGVGIAGEEALRPVLAKLWGFVFAQLPFVSARKLLVRAARADRQTMGKLESSLESVWRRTPSK